MPSFPFGVTLTRVRPAAEGFGGDPGGAGADLDVDGCVVWPGDTTENTDHADQIVADLTTLWPVGTDIVATDQVKDPDNPTGPLCVIVGSPQQYLNPFSGLNPGIIVRLRRNAG
jgi:hypothetical protein